uniref:Replication associated protein n=1 Tax=Cressdnaviricota sp. TaxID=2748378 RepID=A0A8E8D7H9_9VIRU|nr:replication associated protein [Cressdnaviricota sp.]
MTSEVMTSIAPGNTKPGALKARAYQFTLNQPDVYDKLKNILTSLKTMDYMISCKEVAPSTGHEHMHVYAHFSQQYRLPKKIRDLGCHIELCKGSPKQNIAYIRKDGNIIDEIGDEPHQGARTVKELREADPDSIDPHLYRVKKQIDAEAHDLDTFMKMLDEIENDNLKAPTVIYITGDSGKGKTYSAYKRALKDYPKQKIGKLTLKNDFIDVINPDADCFVIEEFRPSQIKASDFLQLTDKYGYRCNIKGGFCTLRPKCIIICSIIPPEKIYKDEVNKQFIRRITEQINLGHEPTPEEELLD